MSSAGRVPVAEGSISGALAEGLRHHGFDSGPPPSSAVEARTATIAPTGQVTL